MQQHTQRLAALALGEIYSEYSSVRRALSFLLREEPLMRDGVMGNKSIGMNVDAGSVR